MAEVEIPQYFVCPISFQIMEDPVTTVTGITYDRESIEEWLRKAKDCVCPVTKQSLPRSSQYLTPNHTLRRLIQAWCSANTANGVDPIPTPKTPLSMIQVQKLVKGLDAPHSFGTSLEKLHALAAQSQRNRTCMAEAGVAKAMVKLINNNFKDGNTKTSSVEEALRIVHLLWNNNHSSMKPLVGESLDFINSLTWVLKLHLDDSNIKMVNEAMPLVKLTIEVADSTLLGNLSLDFFKEMVRVLKKRALSQQTIKSALHVLVQTCVLGRNRTRIVEAGAVAEVIELELEKPEKNMTELIFNLLAHLCCCAEGREQFLRHAAGIAVVSKRVLRVSALTDDRAIHVFSVIAKFSASNEVVLEMLRVGAVSKLCMVMQADCAGYLKEKARDILRLHSKVWNNSPCIQLYLFTRHQR
ncbi:E3 ubiquitin-protein ligase PUB23-like [Vigna unguiculata]|uniref:U-box domain-containing protein n=1 Tax=Vigna unguiculata TaxID=3917 RepID=A0A4D6LI00_VIGUN|nr:E3 ubiquitin-protein ligase PUB23-like [Vigna unguiculata]QCD87986.1 STIP1 homology and U-box containing protein 1 [Vigna unguiculata]